MKSKLLLLISIAVLMTSCYSSTVNHGEVDKYTPMVKVASQKNPILLWGLLPLGGATQNAADIFGDQTDYRTKNQWTFVDGLLNFITIGIYSPTTTSYYLPFDGTLGSKQRLSNVNQGKQKESNDTRQKKQVKNQQKKANKPQKRNQQKTRTPRKDNYQYYNE